MRGTPRTRGKKPFFFIYILYIMFDACFFKTLTDKEKIEYINNLFEPLVLAKQKEDCSCGGHPAKNNTVEYP